MMHGNQRFRSLLSMFVALLLGAIATAPPWHMLHESRVAPPTVAQAHPRSDRNATACDEGSGSPATECAVCFTKRLLLSTSLPGHVDDSFGPPPEVGARVEPSLVTLAGDRFTAGSRAPPLS